MGQAPTEKGAIQVIETLTTHGHQALLAGGCVRDKLRGVPAKDFDVATSASPDQIQKIFPKTVPVGVQFGVILVIHQEAAYEVATFRTEGSYKDGRRPDNVKFTTLEEDAKRRDFTVNGLYFDPKSNKILDFVGGQKDLAKKIIRPIGNAEARFLEDHLRMIRAIRFAVQLGFEIEASCFEAIQRHAALIEKVSKERIRDEFVKTITSSAPRKGIELLGESKLLIHFLPEVERLKGVEQPSEYHPEGDVYVHTLMLMEGLSSPPVELAMGCLLHDIAKPDTFVRAPDRIRFHGHDRIGAEKSEQICKRLAFPNAQTELICSLVAEHLRFKDAFSMRKSTLRRFLSLDRFDLHLELHRLDCLASHKDLRAYEFCKQKLAEFQAEPPPPMKLLTGQDLIDLGYKPGPDMGKILYALEDAILETKVKTKEEALSFVEEHFPLKALK